VKSVLIHTLPYRLYAKSTAQLRHEQQAVPLQSKGHNAVHSTEAKTCQLKQQNLSEPSHSAEQHRLSQQRTRRNSLLQDLVLPTVAGAQAARDVTECPVISGILQPRAKTRWIIAQRMQGGLQGLHDFHQQLCRKYDPSEHLQSKTNRDTGKSEVTNNRSSRDNKYAQGCFASRVKHQGRETNSQPAMTLLGWDEARVQWCQLSFKLHALWRLMNSGDSKAEVAFRSRLKKLNSKQRNLINRLQLAKRALADGVPPTRERADKNYRLVAYPGFGAVLEPIFMTDHDRILAQDMQKAVVRDQMNAIRNKETSSTIKAKVGELGFKSKVVVQRNTANAMARQELRRRLRSSEEKEVYDSSLDIKTNFLNRE